VKLLAALLERLWDIMWVDALVVYLAVGTAVHWADAMVENWADAMVVNLGARQAEQKAASKAAPLVVQTVNLWGGLMADYSAPHWAAPSDTLRVRDSAASSVAVTEPSLVV
jgi:hypothetical protein